VVISSHADAANGKIQHLTRQESLKSFKSFVSFIHAVENEEKMAASTHSDARFLIGQ